MHKDVDPFLENNAVLEPPDADYLFSAKVSRYIYKTRVIFICRKNAK